MLLIAAQLPVIVWVCCNRSSIITFTIVCFIVSLRARHHVGPCAHPWPHGCDGTDPASSHSSLLVSLFHCVHTIVQVPALTPGLMGVMEQIQHHHIHHCLFHRFIACAPSCRFLPSPLACGCAVIDPASSLFFCCFICFIVSLRAHHRAGSCAHLWPRGCAACALLPTLASHCAGSGCVPAVPNQGLCAVCVVWCVVCV